MLAAAAIQRDEQKILILKELLPKSSKISDSNHQATKENSAMLTAMNHISENIAQDSINDVTIPEQVINIYLTNL